MKAVIGSVVIAATLVGCNADDALSICDAYAEYVASADDAIAADVTEVSVVDAITALEALDAEAAQLRAVSDTQNEAVVDELDQALRDLINTLRTADDAEAPIADFADLIDDDTERVLDADASLRATFEPICTTPD